MNNRDEQLEARLTAALRRLPVAPAPSNFTARVLAAVEANERESARSRHWHWSWRFIFPRLTVAAAVLVFVGVSLRHYETNSHRVALAQNLALAARAPSPGVDALENLEAIQRMSQTGRADGELLAALQ